jgi:hypothetical protein
MAIATINRFIALFDQSFAALSIPIEMAQTERLAVLVHQAMNSKTRTYHTAGHVFSMCEGMKPLQVLAALFHDVVYYQLDAGYPAGAQHLLSDVAHAEHGELVLQAVADTEPALALCAAVFNFKAGQTLPLYGGMNEFLSAALAMRLLSPYLDPAQLIAIAACIEATIPFRPPVEGITAVDAMAQRVRQQYRLHAPQADDDGLHALVQQTVRDAVVLANRDVGGFGKADPGAFLSTTWLLIDESNAPLSNPGVYSVQDYRGALVRMAGFLGHLDASNIFQQYGTTPSADALSHLSAAAQRNIAFACDFLNAKITSIAIIEALALCTGTDCPVSMFLGDMRSEDGPPDRAQDFLPPAPTGRTVNPALLAVFENGRSVQSSNDLTASPLTAFTYQSMGTEGTLLALAQANAMFEGALTPQAFLQALDPALVRAISQACARIALSRADALRALAHSL